MSHRTFHTSGTIPDNIICSLPDQTLLRVHIRRVEEPTVRSLVDELKRSETPIALADVISDVDLCTTGGSSTGGVNRRGDDLAVGVVEVSSLCGGGIVHQCRLEYVGEGLEGVDVGAFYGSYGLHGSRLSSPAEDDLFRLRLRLHEFTEDGARGAAVAVLYEKYVFGAEYGWCDVLEVAIVADVGGAAKGEFVVEIITTERSEVVAVVLFGTEAKGRDDQLCVAREREKGAFSTYKSFHESNS